MKKILESISAPLSLFWTCLELDLESDLVGAERVECREESPVSTKLHGSLRFGRVDIFFFAFLLSKDVNDTLKIGTVPCQFCPP